MKLFLTYSVYLGYFNICINDLIEYLKDDIISLPNHYVGTTQTTIVYWLFKHPWRIQYFIMNVLLLLLLWWWILDAFLLRYLRKYVYTNTTTTFICMCTHLFILLFHCISSLLFTFILSTFFIFYNTHFW